MSKTKAVESKFAPGQLVRFTDAGLAKYRANPRDEMVFERSQETQKIEEFPVDAKTVVWYARTRYALVRYSDGSEAVYEEEFLEAV